MNSFRVDTRLCCLLLRLCLVAFLLVQSGVLGAGAAFAKSPFEPPEDSEADLELVEVEDLAALAPGPTVLMFTRLDCPVSQRYASVMTRISHRFLDSVDVVTVYVEPAAQSTKVAQHFADFPSSGKAVLDHRGELAGFLDVEISSTVVVIDAKGALAYRGRIDDRYVRLGLRRSEPTQHDLVEVLDRIVEGRATPLRETQAVGCYLDMETNLDSGMGTDARYRAVEPGQQ